MKPAPELFPAGIAGTDEIQLPALLPPIQRSGNAGNPASEPDRLAGNRLLWMSPRKTTVHRNVDRGSLKLDSKFVDRALP
jgi:hypothetical protein